MKSTKKKSGGLLLAAAAGLLLGRLLALASLALAAALFTLAGGLALFELHTPGVNEFFTFLRFVKT